MLNQVNYHFVFDLLKLKDAKEVWNNTSDTLIFNLRKTLHYWQKYYDNWIASDKHIGKSNEK